MLNKTIIFTLIFIGLFLIPFSFAQDNSTEVLSDDSSYSDIYFDASLADDNGDGSKENPYKYLNSSRIKDNSNIHLADGLYELDSSTTVYNYNAFMGESMENTIITYNKAGYLFSNRGTLILNNLTIKGASIYNTNTLIADNVIFRDSNSDYGGSIYSLPAVLNISNSYFINNTAKLGGAICDIGSSMTLINITAINNSAVYQGGAIYKMYAELNLTSSLFINNSAGEGESVFCDFSIFSMVNNTFNQNNVYSVVNSEENFVNNTFNQAELVKLDYYNINFERPDYIQMFYNPYNSTIPSRYNLKDYGWVTPVKNQGYDGNCWAFAGIGALESCILKATGLVFDFSEENMKNLMATFSDYGWTHPTNNGGTDDMIIGYFSSWMGPVNESDDEYIIDTYLSPLMESIMHVQNVIYLPRSSYTDNDAIKQAILNYGAVCTSLYSTHSKYQYYKGTESPNHAVVIVGWDDNMPKSNFSGSPPGDGAWICKNSWGSSWGDEGYFYVSYYDTRFAQVGDAYASYTFIFNDTVKFDKNYQYDVVGKTDFLLTNQSNIWYQNTFNATSDDIIAAFSTYFNAESNFTVEIYVNNELKLTQNGTSPAGYFTINLDEFIPIYENDLFKIVIKLTSSSEAWVPISEKVSSTRVHYRPNTSFISYDGINWIDLYDYNLTLPDRGHYYNSQVACIKVFTIFNLTTTTSLNNVSGYDTNWVNFTATVKDQYGHLINEGYVIFEYEGISYNKTIVNGIANLSLNNLKYEYSNLTAVYMNNTHYSASSDQLTIYRFKHDVNLTVNVGDVYFGDNFKADVSLIDENGTPINASLMLTVGDKSYNIQSNSIFIVPDLFSAGNYDVSVVYDGDDSHYGDVAYCNASVNKCDVNLGLKVKNVTYGEYFSFNISLTFNSELINENVTLNINNVNYTVPANSEFTLPVILNASTYNVNVYYNGNETFNAKNLTVNVEVFKINPNLEFKINNIKYGEDLIAEVKLTGLNNSKLNEDVILTVNNKKYTFKANNNYTIPIKLDASTYGANVTFNGNTNYNSANNNTRFTVFKNDVNIDLFISNTTYGEQITINTYLNDLKGNLINEKLQLEINGSLYEIISNSEFILPVILNASTYDANLSFEGDNNYNKNYVIKSFTVSKAPLKMDLDIKTDADEALITVRFSKAINETVQIKVNSRPYEVKSKNGIATLSLSNLDYGAYTVESIFSSDNYQSAYAKGNFTVDVIKTKLDADNLVMYYHDKSRFYVTLKDIYNTPLANQNVFITINGVKNSKTTDNDGSTSIAINLNSGTYQLSVDYAGTDLYLNSSILRTVTVKSTVISSDIVKYYKNGTQYHATILDYSGNKVTNTNVVMNINGVFYNKVTDSEGVVTLNINLPPKSYILTVTNPVTGENAANNIKVLSRLVDNNDLVKYYKNDSRYSVKLLDEKGSPLSGVYITFNINGVFYKRLTDSNGVASLAINLVPGDYIITAEYDGSRVSNNIKVLTVIKTIDIVMHYGDGTAFKATILDGKGNPYPNQSVTFNINGVFYTRTSNSTGVANLNINLPPGKYIITSSYNGLNAANTIEIKNF